MHADSDMAQNVFMNGPPSLPHQVSQPPYISWGPIAITPIGPVYLKTVNKRHLFSAILQVDQAQ